MDMGNVRVSDIIVQVAATIIAAGILGLIAQGFGWNRRLTALERDMKDVLRHMKTRQNEFRDSHEIFEDGEYHHKRSRRV